jgi:hypothetical protein
MVPERIVTQNSVWEERVLVILISEKKSVQNAVPVSVILRKDFRNGVPSQNTPAYPYA